MELLILDEYYYIILNLLFRAIGRRYFSMLTLDDYLLLSYKVDPGKYIRRIREHFNHRFARYRPLNSDVVGKKILYFGRKKRTIASVVDSNTLSESFLFLTLKRIQL